VQAADSEKAGSIATTLRSSLESLRDLKAVGEVRGIGLLWGLEFVADRASKRPFPADLNFAAKVGQAAFARGLLVYPMQGCIDGTSGDHLLLAPPAVITEAEVSWAVQELRAAIQETK
jgi:adenosylmethionine-8-amino-7-oxononanoate aminotransferase